MSPRLPITAPIRGVPHARKIFTIRRLSAFYQVGAALTLWVQLSFGQRLTLIRTQPDELPARKRANGTRGLPRPSDRGRARSSSRMDCTRPLDGSHFGVTVADKNRCE